jgi:hypothetical protein
LPDSQWFEPVHGPHCAPFVPHALSPVPAWHLPVASQHPLQLELSQA